jgi:hypothetical protein
MNLREAAQALVLLFPNADHAQSPPPTRDGLLKWATDCRLIHPKKERREQVLMIIEHSRESAEPPSVAEIFEAAYGDPSGKEYWRLWLKHGAGAEVERLLTAHFVAECQDIAAAGHPLGWSWEACCVVALGSYPSGQLRDRLKSILDDEELAYLIPLSARAFVVSETTVATASDRRSLRVPERGKKTARLLLNVTLALRDIDPTMDREAMRKAVEGKIGCTISLATLDRARKQARP